ncbi:Leucine--tRNA ligase [Phycisphaerae bacterium RAS1]|nr:Leucine--tRNA ligase [Phycisphaerae bacterium RAS1]
MSHSHPFNEIDARWQAYWAENHTFRAANPGQPGGEKPHYYILDFFPYPSGAGLHVGHPLGYIASDIFSRFMRMRGYNVLHPMGWDAFGLPAEQYAIETGVHPAITTRSNIDTYTLQLRKIGLSYDWDRELATCDEKYYRWTQWIFLRIYNSWYDPEWEWTDPAGRKVRGAARRIETLPIPADVKAQGPAAVAAYQSEHRLAYLAEVAVNWCPALGTVLSNEEVTNDGRSERGNHPVFRRPLKQWMLRITEYAERLLLDLDGLDWPEPIKLMQRNWIGRSEGAYIDFHLTAEHAGDVIRVFTTRPDTVFGATYMVLAPEHRLVSIITRPEQRAAVDAYVSQARQRSDLDRTADSKVKTGVFTGAYAVNPVNRQPIPIWVADYVLIGYGTGSIMAVPGHDTRDLEFARTFGLPVVQVVRPQDDATEWRGYVGDGVGVNSPPQATFEGQCTINGLPTPEAKRTVIRWLEERDLGEGTVQYKLRDWLFSRQRYWGEPFPILYRPDGLIEAVDERELPVALPAMDDFKPQASDNPNAQPQTPLSRAREWATVKRGDALLRRELNTMPQWAGSCWYYLRFLDPHNETAFVDSKVERYWMSGRRADGSPKTGGVDLYLGGAEHAVLHLLYARFWHKVLYDLGCVSTPEPFQKLFNQGMIGAAAYHDERGTYVPAEEVSEGPPAALRIGHSEHTTTHYWQDRPVVQLFEKMSKSKKNVVNPDSIIAEYGADTLRLYEMYMGPLEASKPWNTRDIIGVHRFLLRVWRLVIDEQDDARVDPSRDEPGDNPRRDGPRDYPSRDREGAVAPEGAPREPLPHGRGSDSARLSAKIGDRRDADVERLLHRTIRKVTEDIPRFAYNTAIAQMIVWVNEAQKAAALARDQIERFVLILAPFAPHVCEELWRALGHSQSLAHAPWPAFDEALTRDESVELAVQLNGKIKARITVSADAADDAVISAAAAAAAEHLAGKPIKRSVVVKGRLVNLIV